MGQVLLKKKHLEFKNQTNIFIFIRGFDLGTKGEKYKITIYVRAENNPKEIKSLSLKAENFFLINKTCSFQDLNMQSGSSIVYRKGNIQQVTSFPMHGTATVKKLAKKTSTFLKFDFKNGWNDIKATINKKKTLIDIKYYPGNLSKATK